MLLLILSSRVMPMSGSQHSNSQRKSSSMKICPYCTEAISPSAKKCKHCGEFVDEKARKQRQKAKIAGVFGLLTASLSLFYPIREGYFYLQQKQQQRTELSSYKQVAKHFESLDSLKYAQKALTRALNLAPNDTDLQRRLLVLQAQELLREIDCSSTIQTQHQPVIEDMILDGYRLLQTDLIDAQRAQLLTIVARLLPQDRYWNDNDAVSELYAQAYALVADNAQIVFRYGQWLVEAEVDVDKGIKLLTQAVQLNPDDAVYPHELARILQKKGEYGLALPLLQSAINLLPKQRELQRIRASNDSKAKLRKLLVNADKEQDIAQGEFYGLSMKERQQLIEQVLQDRQKDRSINYIAARFYYANQQDKLAEDAISKSLSDEDLSQMTRGYYLKEFALYKNILKRTGTQPHKLNEIKQAFAKYQEAESYDEALETGIEGEHRYKIGLRLKKQDDTGDKPQGLLVLKAYSGYPFASAGVQVGDRLLMLAHRQPTSVMGIYRILSNFEAGTSVPLSIERNGKELEVELVIE
jgi:tetratricopeptide (TPR) repeat protein